MRDFRDYLDLEAALQRKLLDAWRPQATELFNHINDLVVAGKFDDARKAVQDIDFSQVGDECRNYIKYILQACIYFGAGMAHGGRPGGTFASAASHDDLLNHVTDNFLVTLNYNVTQETQQAALQSIAQAEAEPVTKAEKVRYVKDFVSFQQRGNDMLKLVSSLHSSRLSTWGFVAEASVIGFTEYEITAVLDGRTSEFCRAINGKKFKVQDAREFVNKVLKVKDPNDVKTIQPWPKQDKSSIDAFRKATPAELTAMGLHIPPYHPYCRTMCTAVKSAPRLEAPTVEEENRIIPQKPATVTDFSDIGITVTPNQLDQWNGYLPVSPVDATAKVTGTTGKEVLDTYGPKTPPAPAPTTTPVPAKPPMISFPDNGDIVFKVATPLVGGGAFSMNLNYNPYAAVMSVVSAAFSKAPPVAAAEHLRKVMNGVVDVGLSVGASSFAMGVDGASVRSYTSMGFSTTPADWFDLKSDIMDRLANGARSIDSLTAEEQQAVMDVLSSRDEGALQVLLNLPFMVEGQQIGDYLLEGEALNMSLPLDNPNRVQAFREATQ